MFLCSKLYSLTCMRGLTFPKLLRSASDFLQNRQLIISPNAVMSFGILVLTPFVKFLSVVLLQRMSASGLCMHQTICECEFISSFCLDVFLVSYFCLVAIARTSSARLNRYVGVNILVIFLILKWNMQVFSIQYISCGIFAGIL